MVGSKCLSRIEKSQFLTDRNVTRRWAGRTIRHRTEGGTGGGGQGAVKPAAAGGGGPQGQALRRLARRRESEPTDNAVELVRYRLAKVGTDPVQPTLNMWPTCP